MIWVWINSVVAFLRKLFVPPVPQPVFQKIDPNEICPSCGARDGKITAIETTAGPLVEHACNVCAAKFCVKPVLDISKYIKASKPAQGD